ncbi:hypothetical protein H7097_04090 [Aeromicrobium sp.]|nr:hypothetical protein [Candidatus Saccharibacteria bacterium]
MPIVPDASVGTTSYVYRAEQDFGRSDRRIFAGFAGAAAAHTMELGMTDPSRAVDVSRTINAFGAMVVNKHFDALTMSVAKTIDDPSPTDIQISKKIEQARNLRHSQGRKLEITGRPTLRTFPYELIDRYSDEIYSLANGNPYHPDSIVAAKFSAELHQAQSEIFLNDETPARGVGLYAEEPPVLTPTAALYPQIAITDRLVTMFHALDLPVEAAAGEVVLASFGKRLKRLSSAVGVSAVHPNGHIILKENGRDSHNIIHLS